jgi:hypothetical protein
MAFARIRTQFPEEVTDLCEALIQAGYVVETIRPNEFRIAPADLELVVDKLPAVEAWRRLPEADTVFVAPGTPCSGKVRGEAQGKPESTPLFAHVDLKAKAVEQWTFVSQWLHRQGRELRGRAHDAQHHVKQKAYELGEKSAAFRRKWTPPREYQGELRLDSKAPERPVESRELRIDGVIEHARLKQEELRRQQQAEQQFLIEQARQAEESRRRAREAAEARALLEEQQRIDQMVRATERVRERVVDATPPAPRRQERRRPRLLPRTRRERAFFRAGIASIVASLFLGMLAAQALHPRVASQTIPTAVANTSVPFTKPASVPLTNVSAGEAPEAKTDSETLPAPSPSFAASAPVTTAVLKSPKPSAGRRANDDIAEDEVVIVHRPAVARSAKPKSPATIAHYSDLD